MITTLTEAALALSAWVELSILGKATIILIAGLCAARIASRTSASVRHLILAVTVATLTLLPIVGVAIPGVTIELPVTQGSDSIARSNVQPAVQTLVTPDNIHDGQEKIKNNLWTMPSVLMIFRLAWLAGALLLLGALAIDLLRLRRIRSHGLPWPALRQITQSLAVECGVSRSVDVLLHEDVTAPLTCGVLRPTIVLPLDAQDWAEADLRRALVHELEHVRRGDWMIQLLARATCAGYWFHPLVWVARRSLCLEAERACDDAVIQNAKPAEYAEQLVLLARRLSSARVQPTLGMANRHDLATRVSALLDRSQSRGRAGIFMIASALSLGGLLVIAIAPVRAVALIEAPSFAFAPESGGQEPQARVPNRVSQRPQRAPAPSDEALYEATEKGDTAAIEKLLDAGARVNAELDGDGTPLIGAAREGHLEAVQLLLDRGADPNLAVSGDGNPLIMAAREGHADVVKLLLDRGAAIDQIVPGDENALIQSSHEGHLEIVKLLVKRGADVNVRARAEGEWRTPLGMAVKEGNKSVVDFLISAGARE